MELTREVWEGLAATFSEEEIEFLPRAHSNGKALGLAYIDARTVMNRLDAVVGAGNWSFEFEVVSPDGKMVKGRLTVLGVTKCDAGEGSTEDEVLKSAVSDALKRCAVHFGIGRYLYYLPRVWAPYDSQKRRFSEPPRHERGAIEAALRTCGIGSPAPAGPAPRIEVAAGDPLEAAEREALRLAPPSGSGPPESNGDRAATESGGVMVCGAEGCGKHLTKGQFEVSTSRFGRPLCPACQRASARAA